MERNTTLFTLPSDLLPFIFSFLRPKELCCLDSAILNHTDRTLFLSALLQRFTKKSLFHGTADSYYTEINWYLCRRIPITSLTLNEIRPSGLIAMNSTSIQEINLEKVILTEEDALGLVHCSNVTHLNFDDILIPTNFDISSIFQNLTNLEHLALSDAPVSSRTAHMISQNCQSLKNLQILNVAGVGDEELRILVEGCHALRSLRLAFLNLTDNSMRMLMSHRPGIQSFGIFECQGVSVQSVLSLLREINVPTIFNSAGEEFSLDALMNLTFSIPDLGRDSDNLYLQFLQSLINPFVELLSRRQLTQYALIYYFSHLAYCGYHRLLVEGGVVPIMVRHFSSYDRGEIEFCTSLFQILSSKPSCQQHLLTSGVLSIFRRCLLQLPKVSKSEQNDVI
jgi:hypothetical protein